MSWILITAPLMALALGLGVLPVLVGLLRERRFAAELAEGLAASTSSTVVVIDPRPDRPDRREWPSGWVA